MIRTQAWRIGLVHFVFFDLQVIATVTFLKSVTIENAILGGLGISEHYVKQSNIYSIERN